MRAHAWMRTEGRLAIVCAWCATKAEADAQAAAAGLEVSHGICPACAERMMPAPGAAREITPDAFTPELPAFSCAVGSATAGRDRRTFDAAGKGRLAAARTGAPARPGPTTPGAGCESHTGAPVTVASTPEGGAGRVEYLYEWQVAAIAGLPRLTVWPEHWIEGRHWRRGARGREIAGWAVVDLVGECSVHGQRAAALALWQWLVEWNARRMDAEGGA